MGIMAKYLKPGAGRDRQSIPGRTSTPGSRRCLRSLLPDRNIDFGLPGDVVEEPEEMTMEPASDEPAAEPAAEAPKEGTSNNYDKEELILRLLKELDSGKGAPRDELESRCAEEGISSMELEELIEGLLDKGLAYEPNLKYIKRIDD